MFTTANKGSTPNYILKNQKSLMASGTVHEQNFSYASERVSFCGWLCPSTK